MNRNFRSVYFKTIASDNKAILQIIYRIEIQKRKNDCDVFHLIKPAV